MDVNTPGSEEVEPEWTSINETSDEELLDETDMDSLHILPLSVLPIQTAALKRARMIKNIQLRSVVEVFNEDKAGSGQLEIEQLDREYGWPPEQEHPDRTLLRKMATLSSYDVFSLRVALREQGIPVAGNKGLELSPDKKTQLTAYMKTFTQPLIKEIYGDEVAGGADSDDLIALFRDPDVSKARERLELMARKLEIEVDGVPRFLEDYGDIFLSFSYYRQCLDQIAPLVTDLINSLDIVRSNWQMKHEARLMETCASIENDINEALANITGRFENFDKSSQDMWENLSAKRFHRVEQLIRSYHTTIGGVLCALTIKLRAWKRIFPDQNLIPPVKLAEFIMSDLQQGLSKVQKIEASAPMLSDMD